MCWTAGVREVREVWMCGEGEDRGWAARLEACTRVGGWEERGRGRVYGLQSISGGGDVDERGVARVGGGMDGDG